MTHHVKYRLRGGLSIGGYWENYNGSTNIGDFQYDYVSGHTMEKLISDDHPYPQGKKRSHRAYNGSLDNGGPFSVQRVQRIAFPYVAVNAISGTQGVGIWRRYNGCIMPLGALTVPPTINGVPPLISNPTMVGKGIEGWYRYKPTHPQVGLGQTLGELRSLGGLPISPKMLLDLKGVAGQILHSKKTVANFLKHPDLLKPAGFAGSAYLGYQFGIAPFVKDLTDLAKGLLNFDKNIQQLVRDNGRGVRRKGRVSLNTTVSEAVTKSSSGLVTPALSTGFWGPSERHVKTTQELEFWFSGRFRYDIDPRRHGWSVIPDRERYRLNRILYGIDPTDVHLIYQLMPWSWLIDWIVPIGPMIDNLVNDREDNLTADYAYIMGKSTTTVDRIVRGTMVGKPFTASETVIQTTKQRAKATPYGFGLSFTGFSPKQLAILAALGVSR